MEQDTPTIRKLRQDFELTFPTLASTCAIVDNTSLFEREGKGYKSHTLHMMWLSWISCYETYVGTTQA